jgi:hypothetical protein
MFWDQAVNFNDYVHLCLMVKMKSLRYKFKNIFLLIEHLFIWSKAQNISFKYYETIFRLGIWWNWC